MDDDLESYLEQYDGPQQETKRAIGRYLHNRPRDEHTPAEIHQAIDVDVTQGTVENNLSDLKEEMDCIEQDKQLVYSWGGDGRPKSLRETVGELQTAAAETLTQDRLGGAFFPTVIAVTIFIAGLVNGVFFTLLSLLGRNRLWDTTARETLLAAGSATTFATAMLLVAPLILGLERLVARL
ncbi:hypothetical protein ACFR9U_14195 [Halorientalis brevis]|uniref:Uncharacterized protein n=1 Tax=Halorientalis brevis TaxID=1126241 RepID=A0ABD6CCS4_9EURY|nr:hypothetical protein [Halorientalis brevis]